MKKRLPTLASLLFFSYASCIAASFGTLVETPANRIRIVSQSAGQIVPLPAVLPGHFGKNMLEMEKNFRIAFSPGVEGTYEVTIRVLEYHGYTVPAIRFGGKLLQPEIDRKNDIATLRYPGISVDASGTEMDFGIPAGKRVGLLSIAQRIDRKPFQKVDAWNISGGAAQTWFYSPKQFSNYIFLIRTESPAELFANGKSYAKLKPGIDNEIKILWHKSTTGSITSLELKYDPGTKFSVKTSPLGGAKFFRTVPDFLKKPEHVPAQWNTTVLDNGQLRIEVADETFYQGARFERTGIITGASYKGKTFFGLNFDPAERNPKFHDHVSGQAEEFEPVGFQDAPVGGAFIRIGNGLYERPNMPAPFFAMPYTPVRILPWKTERQKNRMVFTQILPETNGYAYQYVKTIELADGKPEVKVTYQLKNTGKKPFRTTQYAHNFFRINDLPLNDSFRITYPKECTVLEGKKRVKFTAPGKERASVSGFEKAKEIKIRVEHLPTKTGVEVKPGFVPYRHTLWIGNNFICPESLKLVDLLPGETDTWSRTYRFFSDAR